MQKKDLRNIKWFYGASRGKNHAVLFVDAVSLALRMRHPKKVYGFPYAGRYYLQCDGARSIGAIDERATTKLLDRMMQKQSARRSLSAGGPDFFYRYGTKMLALETKIRKWTDNVKKTDWKKAPNTKLASVIRAHCVLQSELWAIPLAYAYYFYLNDRLVGPFLEQLRLRMGDRLNALLSAILAPEKMSEISGERRALLSLARKAKGEGIDRSAIVRHWNRYAYLNNYYYSGHGYSFKEMLERLEEATHLNDDDVAKEFDTLRTVKLRYSLFTPKERVMIRSMRRMAHAFQYADETLAYCIHHIRGTYIEAAQRFGITFEQLVSMRLAEIEESLRTKRLVVSGDELSLRYRDHVFIAAGGKTYVLTGKEADALKRRLQGANSADVSELKGAVAYKGLSAQSGGTVRGVVRIISHADEIGEFRDGEILVTAMTNPSFVPAMRKAAAIVTNDGGLLCHAAIVSRELRVPCVIGTKIATKVLKDGDMVEVDTNKGVIRRLQ